MANNIRSSQLLSPFGIGQIINFPKEVSLMVCGLDLWDDNIEKIKKNAGIDGIDFEILKISEPRLQKLLDVEFFIKPFPYKTSGNKNKYLTIPVVRFPNWHHCTNTICGRMKEIELTMADDLIKCTTCNSKMIPVRFIAVCPEGHIQDVPFKEWAHNGPITDLTQDHQLFYHSLGGSGDLGSILIKCSCGATKTLAGLMNVRKNGSEVFDSALARIGLSKNELEVFNETNRNDNNPNGQYCKGYRPWLGLEGINNAQHCGNHLQVLIRGGSNVHYSDIISALYLPEGSPDANDYVLKVIERLERNVLKSYYEQDNGIAILPAILSMQPEVQNKLISKEELLAGIITELSHNVNSNAEVTTEEGLRLEEYNYILNGRNSENADFKAVIKQFDDYVEKELLEKYFEFVVLIEKLKETRVFKGFSRINPGNRVDKSELSKKDVTWLPAYEVYGEGIFLKFRDESIENWQTQHGEYFSNNISRYHSSMSKRRPMDATREIDASFIMMHTFAHLLIKKLCFSCGYGSSSLRERIYFSNDDENKMNGIIIYTSSGDSEGSLGGLVRQGKENYLGKLVKDAIADAKWCSADPVCSDIGQSSGQGPDNINGSACHNCCIIPETSCEEFNMLLDRATITGTLNENIGFFNIE